MPERRGRGGGACSTLPLWGAASTVERGPLCGVGLHCVGRGSVCVGGTALWGEDSSVGQDTSVGRGSLCEVGVLLCGARPLCGAGVPLWGEIPLCVWGPCVGWDPCMRASPY